MTEHAFGNDIAINQDGVLWVWGTEKLLSVEQISSPIKILDAVASIDVLYFSSSNRISIYALRIYGCHQIERLIVVVE